MEESCEIREPNRANIDAKRDLYCAHRRAFQVVPVLVTACRPTNRLMPRVCGSIARSRRHSTSSSAADLRGISIKVLRLRECCGVPLRAFFFAVIVCSGLARTGIGPV